MEKLMDIVSNIDWIFAVVILIGGRYWGFKFFKVSKNPALNFLSFATAFGLIWILIQDFTVGISKESVSNLFLTYLFTTSFYELLAKRLFELVEDWIDTKKNN